MIIGVSGQAGSGKDTVADHLVEKHGFVKVALADPMKRFCMEVFDFTEEQLWGPSDKRNAPDLRFCRAQRENDDPNDIRDIIENVQPMKPYTGDRLNYLTPRLALQTLGTEWGRNCYPDVWVDYALRVAKRLLSGGRYFYLQHVGVELYDPSFHARGGCGLIGDEIKGVVISDIRFKNELAAIKKVGKVARVKRGTGLEGAAGEHRSEAEQKEIPDMAFDYVIANSGTVHQLKLAVDSMMSAINGRMTRYDLNGNDDVPPFKRDG